MRNLRIARFAILAAVLLAGAGCATVCFCAT